MIVSKSRKNQYAECRCSGRLLSSLQGIIFLDVKLYLISLSFQGLITTTTTKVTVDPLFYFLKKLSEVKLLNQDDIKLLKELNMDAFRFSISWARLIPSKCVLFYFIFA